MPAICHARARDGTRLAYHSVGLGPALVMLFPYHVNDLVLNWAVPAHRQATRFLANYFTVINLDLRGAGQSERQIDELTLEALSEDVVTVLDDVGVTQACVCAMGSSVLVAAHLASLVTGRIRRLVLLGAGESEANNRIFELQVLNPAVGSDARASAVVGLGDSENAAALAAVIREALAAETFARYERLVARSDVTAVLERVETSSLVVHASDDQLLPVDAARRIVARMPNAHLLVVQAPSAFAIWNDQVAVDQIVAFLDQRWSGAPDEAPAHRPSASSGRSSRTVLTKREEDVLRLVARGRTNAEISTELFISSNTVSHHLRSVFSKTGSKNRTEAAAFAHRSGLIR